MEPDYSYAWVEATKCFKEVHEAFLKGRFDVADGLCSEMIDWMVEMKVCAKNAKD